jgi:REP element-mobilizing transposase RayT
MIADGLVIYTKILYFHIMSRKYKFRDNDKLYFISYATVYWIDVFIREEYKNIWVESTRFCQDQKGLEVYAWCLMTSHVHMIIGSESALLQDIIRDTKRFTSESITDAIADSNQESRKEWMMWMFERSAQLNSNNTKRQFWQQHNKPIEITSYEMMQQKLNYIHMNPVVAGFVEEPHHWKYSSAIDYAGGKGLLTIMNIE